MGRSLHGHELAAFAAEGEDFGPQFERFRRKRKLPKPAKNKQEAFQLDQTDLDIRAQLAAGRPLAAIFIERQVKVVRVAEGDPNALEPDGSFDFIPEHRETVVLRKRGLSHGELAAHYERESQRCLRLVPKIDGRHDTRAYQSRKRLHGILKGFLDSTAHPEAGALATASLQTLLAQGLGPVQLQTARLLLRQPPGSSLNGFMLAAIVSADPATLVRLLGLTLDIRRDERHLRHVLPAIAQHAPLAVLLDADFQDRLLGRLLRKPDSGAPAVGSRAFHALLLLPDLSATLIERSRNMVWHEPSLLALRRTINYVDALGVAADTVTEPLPQMYLNHLTQCGRRLVRIPHQLDLTAAERDRIARAFADNFAAAAKEPAVHLPAPASAADASRPANRHRTNRSPRLPAPPA